MALALSEAEKGRGRTSPNPMVGCVIVRKGRIVGTGHHRRAGGPHAEIHALRAAGSEARGADLYVNLEPCDHVGRTGPCTEALIEAGIRRVFVGVRDPNPLVDGRGLNRLRRAGVEVHVGLLARPARRLNEAFEKLMRTGRPLTILKIAQSLDGRVATRTGASKWITGPAARRFGHRLRAQVDAIMVGSGTVLADDPSLTARLRGARDPIRIVLDGRCRTPADAAVVRMARRSKAPTWIVTSERAPGARRRSLEAAGAEVILVPTSGKHLHPGRILDVLGGRLVLSVLIEGGPTVAGCFVDHGLVDRVHAFVAPMLIGGRTARSSVEGEGAAKLTDSLRLGVWQVEQLGSDLHVSGTPR